MEALSLRFDDRGLPWELLYADDLVLLADSEEDLKRKLQRWSSGLQALGIEGPCRENESLEIPPVGLQKVVDSRKYPCGVSGKGVSANSIKCTLCMNWNTHVAVVTSTRKLRAEDAEAFHYQDILSRVPRVLNKLEAPCVDPLDDGSIALN